MKTLEKVNPVTKAIFDMYTENTGASMGDSGGAYGRNWERNQKLTLNKALKIPTVSHEITSYNDKHELLITVNVFKYLISANLEFDAICKKFNKINANGKDNDFEQMYGTCQKAGDYLESLEAKIEPPFNTYNDNAQFLSQVLQGAYVEINEEKYILLQIHGGCDVRGGYTNAKLFKLNENTEGYMPLIDILGTIDGVQVDNSYNGYSMTDESGKDVKIKKNSKISLSLSNEY